MRRLGILVLAGLLFPMQCLADAKAGEKKAQLCFLCHKLANAVAPGSAMPLLEAQPARYLYLQTKAYKEKRRAEPAMQTNVASLSDRDMRDIADYLSVQKLPRASYQLESAKIAAGRARAEELRCAACHLPTLYGAGEVPRLAGQTPGYVKVQLEAFGAGKRQHGTGQGSAPAMSLNEEEMDGLAQFLASLE
jgi:cytochrome c553